MPHGHALGKAHAAQRARSENAGQDAANNTAHAVHAKHITRIVHAQKTLQHGHTPQASQPRNDTDNQRSSDTNVATCRCYAHQTCNSTRTSAQQRRFATQRPFTEDPSEDGGSGGDHGIDEGQCGNFIRRSRRTGVKAKPTNVENSGTGEDHRQVMRFKRFFAKTDAFANQIRTNQTSNRCVDVHDRPAGKIQCAVRSQ